MKKFFVALGMLGAVGAVVGTVRAARTWGAMPTERNMELSGDLHVLNPDTVATHGITIDAPPEDIWPWLLQLGQDRGGFYSYEVLENFIGCEIEGVFDIRPEWQSREVGDIVPLAPGVELVVGEIVQNRALVLMEDPTEVGPTFPGLPEHFSWAFVLIPASGGQTRLLTRERYSWGKDGGSLSRMVTVLSCIMTDKMLRTIKVLSEGSPEIAPTAPRAGILY